MVHSENALFHQGQRSYPVTSSRPVLWHKVRKVFLDRFPVDLQQQMVWLRLHSWQGTYCERRNVGKGHSGYGKISLSGG